MQAMWTPGFFVFFDVDLRYPQLPKTATYACYLEKWSIQMDINGLDLTRHSSPQTAKERATPTLLGEVKQSSYQS